MGGWVGSRHVYMNWLGIRYYDVEVSTLYTPEFGVDADSKGDTPLPAADLPPHRLSPLLSHDEGILPCAMKGTEAGGTLICHHPQ